MSLRSPGSNRYCPEPVPEEVLLKLALLGVDLVWRHEFFAWAAAYQNSLLTLDMLISPDEANDWDQIIAMIADRITQLRHPVGWTQTQHVDTMPIEAASCIAEDL